MNASFAPAPFKPRRWLSNGHLQTIAGNFLPRPFALPEPTAELVEVEPASEDRIASQVLCHCHWQTTVAPLTVVLLHGLEGSSSSQYVLGNAAKLWRAGFHVVRMNMRNCGGTEALTSTLYHSGLSGDVLAVVRAVRARHRLGAVALVGYSMGGNLVLKLAGELGVGGSHELSAVAAVSPALDLAESADALHRPANRFYERRFLAALVRRFRHKAALFPDIYEAADVVGLRSLRDFDEQVTARYAGFAGASDYYFRAAAARVLAGIHVPTLLLHALDDPFIRLTASSRAALEANPDVTLLEPAHGGHCAFLAQPGPGDDGYWAESTVLAFLEASPAGSRSGPAILR